MLFGITLFLLSIPCYAETKEFALDALSFGMSEKKVDDIGWEKVASAAYYKTVFKGLDVYIECRFRNDRLSEFHVTPRKKQKDYHRDFLILVAQLAKYYKEEYQHTKKDGKEQFTWIREHAVSILYFNGRIWKLSIVERREKE